MDIVYNLGDNAFLVKIKIWPLWPKNDPRLTFDPIPNMG